MLHHLNSSLDGVSEVRVTRSNEAYQRTKEAKHREGRLLVYLN